MDRTESTIRKLLAALPAHGYDLGILSNKRMQRFVAVSEHRLLRLLPYLKYRNANGAHIFLRPSGESAYTLLDDLSSAALSRMTLDGFAPAAVVETSPKNYQAWIRHKGPLLPNSAHSPQRYSPSVSAQIKAPQTGAGLDALPV